MVTVIRLGLALDANTCVEFASQVKSSQVKSSRGIHLWKVQGDSWVNSHGGRTHASEAAGVR